MPHAPTDLFTIARRVYTLHRGFGHPDWGGDGLLMGLTYVHEAVAHAAEAAGRGDPDGFQRGMAMALLWTLDVAQSAAHDRLPFELAAATGRPAPRLTLDALYISAPAVPPRTNDLLLSLHVDVAAASRLAREVREGEDGPPPAFWAALGRVARAATTAGCLSCGLIEAFEDLVLAGAGFLQARVPA